MPGSARAATDAATEWSGSASGSECSRSTTSEWLAIGSVDPALQTGESSAEPPVSMTTSHISAYSSGRQGHLERRPRR